LKDAFENKLRDMISNNLGKVYASKEYINTRFESSDNKDVYIVDVKKSREPVFVSPIKELYIRTGNSSRQLNMEEFYRWIVKRTRN
jgi:predicted HTH transcriptional regulator